MNRLFQCVVENNIDPLKLGRIQCRIFGKHTDNKEDESLDSYMPTEDLPWASVMYSNGSPNISGKSDFSIPENGSWGICCFFDEEEQLPIFLGTIVKHVEEQPDFESGFADPDGENPSSEYVGYSQISKLATGEDTENTIIQTKKDNVITGVQANEESFDEPETEYATEYPENKVIDTGKHVLEMDNTEGKERIHLYHNSGTFIEVFPDGSIVYKNIGKKYELNIDDKNIYIGGNRNEKIEGDENKQVSGDQKVKILGTKEITLSGDNILEIGGNLELEVTGDMTITVNGNATIEAGGDVEAIAGGNLTLEATGNCDITSTGPINATGNPINLN